MKIRSTTYLTLAALTLGFSLGWWARGPDTEYVSTPPADEYAHANSTANATPRIDQPVEIPSAQSAHKTPNARPVDGKPNRDRKSTRLNSSHVASSYAVFCLKKKT